MAKRLIAGFVLAIVLTAAVYSMMFEQEQKEPDCARLDAQSVRYIVIDVSEKLEAGAKDFISRDVQDVVTTAPARARVVLLQPNEASAYEPEVVDSVCTPVGATPVRDAILHSPNEIRAREERLETARAAIQSAAEASIQKSTTEASSSPLAEALIYISERADFRSASERDIYVYSDMRQKSAASSVYEEDKNSGAYFRTSDLRPTNMKGATVHVRLVRRNKLRAEDQIVPFWTGWVASVKGRIDWPE